MFQARLPADVFVLSGVRVSQVQNSGGLGRAGYQVMALREAPEDNSWEPIIIAQDFAWACIFTHEAGVYSEERFYDRTGPDFETR
jgi:hypothetical protein